MRCANCGNEDPNTLFDEDDKFYCKKSCHRTQTATGQDDLITCPYCGRLRDEKHLNACGVAIQLIRIIHPQEKSMKSLIK